MHKYKYCAILIQCPLQVEYLKHMYAPIPQTRGYMFYTCWSESMSVLNGLSAYKDEYLKHW